MAHDSRCENANTSPTDCDCECGGDKHGLGFAEEQIHDLETDIPEIEELRKLTPDEYFGDEEGKEAIEDAYTELYSELNEAIDEDNEEAEERIRRDRKRIEEMAAAKGLEFSNTIYKNEDQVKKLKFFLQNETKKYDYDLTDIGSRKKFQELLERNGLSEYKRIRRGEDYNGDPTYSFVWYSPDKELAISTSNNPITGKYKNPFQRQDEPGYASSVAIEGEDTEKVEKLHDDIAETAEHIKAGGEEAGYSAVTGFSKNKIGLFSS